MPLAGLETGLLAGAGLLGLETAVVGLVTLLALLLGGGLLELGLVTLEAQFQYVIRTRAKYS